MVIAVLALALLLLVTDTALSVWDRLAAAPAWVRYAWITGVSAITLLATWLAWRWLRPSPVSNPAESAPALDEVTLEAALEQAEAEGVDIGAARQELERQRQRRSGGVIHLAIFGEVSTGKSALVRALLPAASADPVPLSDRADLAAKSPEPSNDPVSAPTGGTTREVRHHHWRSSGGDEIVIADLPGFNLGDDPALREEARRAHLVIFLTDEDLTASQYEELAALRALDKPLLLALNKTDRYSDEELRALRGRLAERTGLEVKEVVPVRSGGREEIVRVLSGGEEQRESRERAPDIETLRRAIQARLDRNRDLMVSLQDTAVLLLAADKLQRARLARNAEEAGAIVGRYSRRAVVGALAAVAPGSDLVIQGVLATRMLQELCALYDVPAKEMEIESFLKLAGGRIRRMSALTLAIAGNALKAFPGFGTLGGGLVHAVAYGMIFDSLGRAAADTLASRGALPALPATRAFEEKLSESLEQGASRFAQLAIRQARGQKTS